MKRKRPIVFEGKGESLLGLPLKKPKPTKGATFSLKSIAQQFVGVCTQSESGVVDLKQTTDQLGIKKRRIYDITNVLDGIGLLKKTNKNFVKWIGTQNSSSKSEKDQLLNEIEMEKSQLKMIDSEVNNRKNELFRLKQDIRSFVTFQELATVFEMKNKQLVTIKIPFGTQLMIPHQTHNGKYPLYLSSKQKNEPIKVFVMNEEKIHGQQKPQQQQQPDFSQMNQQNPIHSLAGDDDMNVPQMDQMKESTMHLPHNMSIQ